ncbi:MAG: LapA family protein [Pseudomonadota bacterium]
MGTSTLVTLIPIVLTVLVGGALLGIVSAVQVARLRRELVELRSDVATLREERDTTPASWSAAVEASALAPLTDETETPNADRQSASDELSPTPTAPDVIAAPPPPPPPSSATPPPPPPAPPGRSRMRFERQRDPTYPDSEL